jgi:hypothetical protein
MPTSGNVRFVDAVPPPALDTGFTGLFTLRVRLPAFATASSAAGTLTVNDVPAALAVPVNGVFNGGVLPRVTCVELLNPVPVKMICCAEVAPAIKPRFGENDDCVGTALSILVGASVADLSVLFASLGSATVAVFVTLGNAPGASETVSVNVLLPPAAASAGPEYVHVTACPFARQDQFAPALETRVRPAGKVSVTVMAPVVAPVPVFVTLMV